MCRTLFCVTDLHLQTDRFTAPAPAPVPEYPRFDDTGFAAIPAPPVVRPRAARSAVRTAVLLIVVLTAGAYLPSPLYPDYQRLFGFDDLTMTLLFATFALVSGPALLLCGAAADTWGRRPVLRLSVLLAAAGSLCFALADGPGWLFAGRIAQALALGAATGAAQSLIMINTGPLARLSGSLIASLAFVGGTAAGPALAGVLARWAPGPLLTPYGLHLAALAVVYWRLRRTVPAKTPATSDSGVRQRPRLPGVPRAVRAVFLVAGLNGFLAWAVVGIHLALVPTLLARTLGQDDPALSGGLLGAVLLLSLVAQPVGARWGARHAQYLGVALLVAGLLLLALTGAASLPATLAAGLLAGAGHGFAFSGATRDVAARTPADRHAAVGSALHLLFYLGSAAPAIVVGVLSARLSLMSAVTALSWAGVLLGVLATLSMLRLDTAERAAARRAEAGEGVVWTEVRETPAFRPPVADALELSPGTTDSPQPTPPECDIAK